MSGAEDRPAPPRADLEGKGEAGGPGVRGGRSPWRMLALLAAAELLGMSLWFAANAVSPQLQQRWQLAPGDAAWLTGIVQLGFVAGTGVAAAFNLADILPARSYFAGSALLGAAANAALLLVLNYPQALVARFFTGFFLAGVYPPAMKMVATWFRARRGLAIGSIVAALTIGKASPYLVHAAGTGGGDEYAVVRSVVLTTTAAAILSALLVAVGYRDGPFQFERRPFSWRLVATVLRDRPTRLATGGYLGHMWELYAMWTWIPAFLLASVAAQGPGAPIASSALDLAAFAAIAVGGLGCLWGGWAATRIGYERVVIRAMAVSGSCALLMGLVFGRSLWLVLPLALLWGFFVIADSAQFSALVTEVAPAHAVGTALTLQTSLGFLLTMVTIQLIPRLADWAGWRWSFAALTLGPLAGIALIRRLQRSF